MNKSLDEVSAVLFEKITIFSVIHEFYIGTVNIYFLFLFGCSVLKNCQSNLALMFCLMFIELH